MGLNRLTHKTLDEKPEAVQLRKSQEGFNEIFNIIDKNYGNFARAPFTRVVLESVR